MRQPIKTTLLINLIAGGLFFSPHLTGADGEVLIGPYVQRVSRHSATILLRTMDPEQLTLQYKEENRTNWKTVSETTSKSIHRFRITTLAPNQTYQYYIADGATHLTRTNQFSTVHAVTENNPLRFVMFADSGHDNIFEARLDALMEDWNPDIIIHGGDIAYETGSMESYINTLFGPFGSLLEDTAFYPTIGNHDFIINRGGPYKSLFELPTGSSGSENYYSFNYDSVHFATINNELPFEQGSAQYAWLKADLEAASDARWKIVWMHYPVYFSGGSEDTLDMTDLVELFEQQGVDAVLTSHAHYYERNKKVNGILYMVTGGGGAPLDSPSDISPYSKVLRSVHHFLGINITPSRLRLQAISDEGKVFDTVRLDK